MSEDRFSLRDSELELPSIDALAERNRASWSAARKRIDPSPRVEIARTFYRDAMRARLRH